MQRLMRLASVIITLGLLAAPVAAQTFQSEVAANLLTPASGTGITIVSAGGPDYPYKVTVGFAALTCNATTCDVTIATAPAKTKITDLVADVTTPFVCAQTCTTATLSFTVGKTAGGTDYLLSADADAAAARFGLTVATTGADLVANLVKGGSVPSWTATTTISMRFASAVGNLATAGVTNLNAGSITFYILAQVMP